MWEPYLLLARLTPSTVESKSEVTSSSGESPALCSRTVFAWAEKWNSSAVQYKKNKAHNIFEVFTSELLKIELTTHIYMG